MDRDQMIYRLFVLTDSVKRLGGDVTDEEVIEFVEKSVRASIEKECASRKWRKKVKA